jgi:hypothetical protein
MLDCIRLIDKFGIAARALETPTSETGRVGVEVDTQLGFQQITQLAVTTVRHRAMVGQDVDSVLTLLI